jgi:hypothetical protein
MSLSFGGEAAELDQASKTGVPMVPILITDRDHLR